MTTRRDFLKATSAAAAVTVLSSSTGKVIASTGTAFPGVVYTKDNPGKWAKKVASHAPKVTITGTTVEVVTEHGQAPKHFIVRHTLVQEDGKVIGAKTFSPEIKPESSYELPAGYKGKLFATSFCNLHDFWLTEVTV